MTERTPLTTYRNSDLRVVYQFPQDTDLTDMVPSFFYRLEAGATPLLTVTNIPTPNGSSAVIIGTAVVVTLKIDDIGVFPAVDVWAGVYDSVLTKNGFVNKFVGGPLTQYVDGSYGDELFGDTVIVSIDGLEIPILIEGGNLGATVNVNLVALANAVEDAESAAVTAVNAASEAVAAKDLAVPAAASAQADAATALAAATSAVSAKELAESAAASADADATQTALDRIATAADAVQTAADRVATGADRVSSAASAAQAMAYRDETAAYAGTTNVAGYYASTAAGIAATTNGQYFGVPTVNGIVIYQNVSGTAVAGPTIPSIDYIGKRAQIIKCTATYNGTGNTYTITPVDAAIRYTGSGVLYVWCYESPTANDQGSGAVSVTIRDGAGTPFATLQVRKRGGVQCDGSEFLAGDLIWIRRFTASETPGANQLLWMETPNAAIPTLAPLIRALGAFGKKPSPSRPTHYYKAGSEQHYIRMRITEDKYLDNQARQGSDQFEVVEHDMARFQADTGNCLAMNSIFTRSRGLMWEDLNMLFDVPSGGTSVDTGLPPTTIESPVIGGKFGDPASLMVVSGPGHGMLVGPVTTLDTIRNDSTTGGVNLPGTINPNATIGTTYYGTTITKTLTALAENVAHDIYAKCTWTTTYEPNEPEQINLKVEWNFADAAVTVTPAFLRGFALIAAATDYNRCQAVVNGVRGPIQTIDLRDDSSTPLGFPEQVIFWHTAFPEKQWVVTNKYGFGYTHKENGVLVPNAPYQSYVQNFDWGIKLYGGLFGDQGSSPVPVNMTGKVITFETGYRMQLADPIV